MEVDNDIIVAEKLLAGVQLITENAETVINSRYTDSNMRFKLRNLLNHCLKIERKFWENMDDDAQKEFQNRIKKIEKIIENEK